MKRNILWHRYTVCASLLLCAVLLPCDVLYAQATNSVIAELLQKSEKGDAKAMFNLGVSYVNGDGIYSNSTEAVKWFRKAADLGEVEAIKQVGFMYFIGRGVPRNQAEAMKWYYKAADLGDDNAKSILEGSGFVDDKGNLQDEATFVKNNRLSAENGDIGAMVRLAGCSADGIGTSQNFTNAVTWYLKAADLGNTDAMAKLGDCYSIGKGVLKDGTESIRWYRKAADGGDTTSMLILGAYYERGLHVPQNDVYAFMWYSLAASREETYARLRDSIRERMTPSQVAEAQRLAYAYSEKNRQPSGAMLNDAEIKKVEASVTGTGFFVTTDGYLVTACHVVAKADKVKVSCMGKVLEAKVIQMDTANDVALLKVDGSFTALAVSPSRSMKLGGDVFTVGFPNVDLQGVSPKLTKGVISGLNGIQDDPSCFQISVAVQPGNSGGPLINSDGQVVGVINSRLNDIATAKLTGSLPQNVNYAVKSAYVLPLLDSISQDSLLLKPERSMTFDNAVKCAENAVCIILSTE